MRACKMMNYQFTHFARLNRCLQTEGLIALHAYYLRTFLPSTIYMVSGCISLT